MKQVYLKRGKEDSLLRYHPWVFSGALHHIDDGIDEGDCVRVMAADGRCLAVGHYQQGSITVRVLSFADTPIDEAFWQRRLASALKVRQVLGLADTYRLVHGEGDLLPGLIIDVYGDSAVMQAHSIGMHRSRHIIAQQLMAVMGSALQSVYYKSETTLPFMELENGYLVAHASQRANVVAHASQRGSSVVAHASECVKEAERTQDKHIAVENGLKFYVDWLRGQKTGFFVDQRDNRALLEHYSQGRRVLNMFCYTGGFSVYALRGGAQLVHSVDSSEKAIELTRRNVAMNFPDDPRHEAFCEDAFKFLDHSRPSPSSLNSPLGSAALPSKEPSALRSAEGRLQGKNSQLSAPSAYDLIILDPPAFAKHRGALHNALKGYTRLNQKAFEKLPSGGLLFTFSCSQVVTKDHFRQAVFTAAALARRKVRILHQLHQPADHPVNIYHPEGEYLKGLVLYVE